MSYIGNTNTTQAFTPAVDFFSGNGSTTAFTLSRPVASVAQVQVNIANVPQNPSTAYTISGNTITFTSAPLSGTNNIYVYYTSPITQVIAPGQGTVQTAQLGNITNIASGNSSLTLQTGTTPTTALTIDTSQNVGIGFSSPQGKLHVSGGRSYFVANSDAYAVSVGYSSYGAYYLGSNSANNALVFSNSAGTEVARIDTSGNVGIGTSSPQNLLNVVKNSLYTSAAANAGVAIQSDSGATYTAGLHFGTDKATAITYIQSDSSASYSAVPLAINPLGGNVGIGTSSPTTYSGTALCVYDTSAPRIRLTNSTTGNTSTVGGELTISGSDFVMENRTSSANILFYNNGAERMRLDSSGNLKFNSGYGSVATAYGCRAWVNFSGATPTIIASGNITSVTKAAVGKYTVNITNAMPDTNYIAVSCTSPGNSQNTQMTAFTDGTGAAVTPTTSSFKVVTGSAGFAGYVDCANAMIAIFR